MVSTGLPLSSPLKAMLLAMYVTAAGSALIRGAAASAARSAFRSRPAAPAVFTIQETGGVRKTVEAGFLEALKLLKQANEARRTRQPHSQLLVGTNCGGSDGNSGITANPAP